MTENIKEKEWIAGPKFAERMKRDDPDHGKFYCDHGIYIGSLKDFSRCPRCPTTTPN